MGWVACDECRITHPVPLHVGHLSAGNSGGAAGNNGVQPDPCSMFGFEFIFRRGG